MSVLSAVILCVTLIGADQLIKFLVVENLKPILFVDVIDDVLRFQYVENTGAIFGSFSSHTIVLTIVSIILLAVVIFIIATKKTKSKLIDFFLLLMVSGGIGNIIDRIRLGYVVDFIEPLFVDFAVFNFADCLITVGAFSLMIYLIVDLIKDAKNNKKKNDTFVADDE
jgi:signal peptidase II